MPQTLSKIMKETLPVYELDDLQEIFGYPNRRALNRALHSGALPIKTFKLRGVRVCHTAVVDQYFEQMKKEGLAALEAANKKPSWDQ